MPNYTLSLIQYSDMTQTSGSTLSSKTTQSTSGSFSVDSNATPLNIVITDDDSVFEDGFIETGAPQVLANDVVINGTNYLAGSVVELEFQVSTTTGERFSYIRIDGRNVGIGSGGGALPQPGSSYTISDSHDGQRAAYDGLACYAEGTLIDTPNGVVAIETLSAGDLVLTKDNSVQKIRWVRQHHQMLESVSSDEKPVLIQKGALGGGRPTQNLIVSPQHRILVGGSGQLDAFFPTECFVPAKALVGLPRIRHMAGKQKVLWCHFACDKHEVINANGCLSETMLLGPMVLKALSRKEYSEVFREFGPLRQDTASLNGPSARVCLSVRAATESIAKNKDLALSA